MPKSRNTDIDERIMLCTSEWETPFSTDISSNKAAVLARINFSETTSEKGVIHKRRFPFLKIAASLAFLIVCGAALYLSGNKTIKNDTVKSILCALPDGSEILITPNSSVSYNALLWPLKRSVDFTGEGFFTVQKGKSFKVHTNVGHVQVLGTKFTVWTDDNDLFVHCSTGHVKVIHETDETDLLTCEFTLLEKGKLTKKMVYPAEGFITPRISNRLNFNAVPVGIVISELEKVFQTEFINELPANLIYTGILDIRNENECLEVFCKPFGAKFDKNSNGVTIHL